MAAAKPLVVGILFAAVATSLSAQAGEIISAGSGSRGIFERSVPTTDGSGPSYGTGSFIQAGSISAGSGPRRTYVVPASPPPAAAPAAVMYVPSAALAPTYKTAAAAAPASVPAPVQMAAASASAPLVISAPPVAVPATPYDAFVNFGSAPFSGLGTLATGTAQSWFASDAVTKAYGGATTSQQAQDFSTAVIGRVASTFAQSGLDIRVTGDPNAPSSHMLSVASGLSASSNPDAVGVATIGKDGFSFIDKLGYATSPDELEWAVAHNVAHELMHAFGGTHHTAADGKNLDAAVSDWSVLIDPNTKFSAESVAEMTRNLRQGGLLATGGASHEMVHPPGCSCAQCQLLHINGVPVPEPTTIAVWGALAGIAGLVRARRRAAR